jgi:hypothetical protein
MIRLRWISSKSNWTDAAAFAASASGASTFRVFHPCCEAGRRSAAIKARIEKLREAKE